MATLDVHGDHLHLSLSGRERVAALHGDVVAPLSAVRSARATEDPFGELRGIRAPGLALPRRVAIGTWRGRGTKDFVVVRRGQPAVIVELGEHAPFDRLVVGASDARERAARIGAAAA